MTYPDNADHGARFNELCQQARDESQAFEAQRQLSPDFARAMANENLFRLFAPKDIGGPEESLISGLSKIETLARNDAASGWVSMIGSTASLMAAYLDQATAQHVFGGEAKVYCGIFAPHGRAYVDGDDIILSGRWAWASGSANADWIGLGAMVQDNQDAPPEQAQMQIIMVPREYLIFHDTWHTIGLRASSSGDIEVQNARLPKSYACTIINNAPRISAPLYQLPYFGFLALGVAACALGNAQSCLQSFKTLAMEKIPASSSRRLADQGRVHIAYAQALASYHAARAFYVRTVEGLWASAQTQSAPFSPEARAELRMAATHATQTCVHVVRTIYDLAGGSSVYDENIIQKHLRDAETMTQHMITGSQTYELVGRVAMGGYAPHMQL